jgi:hypothetical protein
MKNFKSTLQCYIAKYKQYSAADRAVISVAKATWAIAGLSFVTIIVGYWQYSAIKGQLDEMRDEQRPWVSVDPKDGLGISQPLTFKDAMGVGFRVAYKLRNTGKSPALHVRFQAKIVFLPMKESSVIEISRSQDRFCEPIRNIADEFYDNIVFPGDEIGGDWPLGASQSDVNASLKTRDSGPFRHPGFVTPYAIICIDYQLSPKTSNHFQTRYAFLLGIPQSNGTIIGDLKPEGTQPDVRLVFFSQSAE